MLKIKALKFNILTTEDIEFGNYIEFSENGLNIIKSSIKKNTTGKTTLIQSILYCLGMEQVIDGTSKGPSALKPVLRKELEYNNHKYQIKESEIYLEIINHNQEVITIKRSVKNTKQSSDLLTVYYGNKLTNDNKEIKFEDMYVGMNSAKVYRGFYRYLVSDFLNLELPNVIKYDGKESKLYLEVFFSAFYLDQTRGWTDYLVPISNYGIIDVKKKVIEYLLDFDILKNLNNYRKHEIEMKVIELEWKSKVDTLVNTLNWSEFKLEGIPDKISKKPLDISKVKIYTKENDEYILIDDYEKTLMSQHLFLVKKPIKNIGDQIDKHYERLTKQENYFEITTLSYSKLNSEIFLEKNEISIIKNQLKIIEEDLVKNKTEKKLEEMGSEENFSIASNICPTCKTTISHLLSANLPEEIMTLDKNIDFLESQSKMFELQLKSKHKRISLLEQELKILDRELRDTSNSIRLLKEELTDSKNTPSRYDIEKRVKLNFRINQIIEINKTLTTIMEEFKTLSAEYIKAHDNKINLIANDFPEADKNKLKSLKKYLQKNIELFNFTSDNVDNIFIDLETYFPKIDTFKLKSDSSASDYIRTIWAYYIALFEVSKEFSLNHLGLLIIDEPAQQQIDISDLSELFKKVSTLNGCQTLITTSLDNTQLANITKGIDYHEIDTGLQLIKHQ
ncbi:MAG: hypothetical protein WC667_11765 [Sulfurimonas sp.]|jgi:hypothetical protein